jgi:hypothetical protein
MNKSLIFAKSPIKRKLKTRWKSLNIKAFAIGAAVGTFVIIVMPGEWSNLMYMP